MGSKSSGSAHTPVEAKDSLKSTQFVRILDLLGEGSLSGWGNGGDSDDAMLKSTYFNDTPVLSKTGEANFKGAKVAYLLGSEDQGYLPNFDTTENTVAVGTEIKSATPIVRTVTDSQLDRIIVTLRTGQMVSVNDQGDQSGTTVSLKIDLMKNGTVFTGQQVTIKGKTSDHFFRDVEFNTLPEAPFEIRVTRLTSDSSSSKLQNQTYFASYVEIISAKLSYPHSAVVGVEFDSELFGSSIPTRNYLVKGLQIKVPSNYDPEARTYTGFWDGTFKVAFSNNPAWVFYDLVTSRRYGLGRKISPNQVDKWGLYSVAQYCDQLVDNGQGAMEPRFTCNAYLTESRQAYEVLQDLVSCFRGMYVWDGQNVSVTIDRKSDPVAMYTNSNVVDGIFSYSSSPLNTIATAVQVQYVDAEDGYRTKTEYVSDDLAVRRYGLNVKRITSFGCTSRSQAIRTGKWLLETSRLERQTVTFSVGRAGLKHLPYDIIQVVDNDYAGVDMAGRIETVNQNLVTLDRPVSDLTGTEFSYLNTLGKLVTSEIVKQVSPTVLQLVDVIVPHVTATFVIRSKGLGKRFFRALTISEDQDNGSYTINAVEHIPEKESVVDNVVEFEPAPNTIYDRLPIITGTQVQQEGDGVVVEWSGQGSTAGVTYQVKVYRNDLLMNTYNDLVVPVITLSNLQPGKYKLEIRARNKNGQWSEPEIREFVIDYNITTLQATPELWSVRLNWTLPNTAGVGYKTQIWYSETDEFTTAQKLADVATPTTTLTHTNLELMQKYYYWARIEDAKGITGEPSNSVWCGPSTDEKLITDYLKGKVDATLIADETLTIAKFAKSIIPPRFVETLPVLPNPDYAINSIVTYQGALYQNIGNVWKPMMDTDAINQEIDDALAQYAPNIPEAVTSIPAAFTGKNYLTKDGKLYVWNATADKYEVSGIDPELEKNVPTTSATVPTSFTGKNNIIVAGQMYSWDGTKYVAQFDQAKVTADLSALDGKLSKDIPFRVATIPAANNGYNNLVLTSNGQIYSWNGTKYVAQFDQSAVEQTVTDIAEDLVDAKVYELAADVPERVNTIPGAHNGSNNLVLISTGQLFAWDGSNYKAQFSNTLTQAVIDASTIQGTKIANGTISTAQLAAGSVTAGQIATGAITTVKLSANSVTTAQLAAGSVTATQLTSNSVIAGKIASAAVTTDKLDALAVTADKIAVNAITAGKIAANAITANNIVAGTITATELATNSVTAAKIVAGAITANAIAANAITTAKIATGAVTANEIAAGTITANKIATNTITATQIGANTITAAQIAIGTITATEIAASTITGNKIAARTIDAGRIIAGAITANELAVNSITAAKIAAGAVGADQIAARAISTDKMVIGLGNNLVPDPTWESGFENWRFSTGAAAAGIRERTASLYPTTAPSTRVVRITGVTGMMTHKASYATESDGIPVVAGEEYLFSFDLARATSPVTSGSVRVQGYFYCQDGVQRSTTAVITDMNSFAPGPWTSVVVPITVPATAVKMRMYINFTPFSGVAEFCNPVIFKRTTGELIVDGSITTDKLAANSITSAKILAGSIQAAHIAAGTITGDRIAASQTLSAPTINGGTISIGSNAFRVDSSGNMTMTKGSINIANNFIVDAAGNLTAKSGKFEGTVLADSIDTPLAQVGVITLGSTGLSLPATNFNRKVKVEDLEYLMQVPSGMGSLNVNDGFYIKFDLVFTPTGGSATNYLTRGFMVNSSNSQIFHLRRTDIYGNLSSDERFHSGTLRQLVAAVPKVAGMLNINITLGYKRVNESVESLKTNANIKLLSDYGWHGKSKNMGSNYGNKNEPGAISSKDIIVTIFRE